MLTAPGGAGEGQTAWRRRGQGAAEGMGRVGRRLTQKSAIFPLWFLGHFCVCSYIRGKQPPRRAIRCLQPPARGDVHAEDARGGLQRSLLLAMPIAARRGLARGAPAAPHRGRLLVSGLAPPPLRGERSSETSALLPTLGSGVALPEGRHRWSCGDTGRSRPRQTGGSVFLRGTCLMHADLLREGPRVPRQLLQGL